jgi:hypothetical protein
LSAVPVISPVSIFACIGFPQVTHVTDGPMKLLPGSTQTDTVSGLPLDNDRLRLARSSGFSHGPG